MSTVVGIVVLMALFLGFPLIKRERGAGECGRGGCWKKKVGFGCAACPIDEPGSTSTPDLRQGARRTLDELRRE